MRATLFLITLFLLNMFILTAQVTGKIDNKEVGLSFVIPVGWVAQESGEAVILSSQTESGFMLMIEHTSTSIEQIKTDGDVGVSEEGFQLQRSGEYESIGTNGVGAEFTGAIQGEAAKGYVVGLLNPYGSGLTILSMAESSTYSKKYKDLAITFAKSVKFSKPVVPPIANEWKTALKDTKLTYLSSYNSGGGSGGMSAREEIHLCAAGYFKYSSDSSVSMNVDGASGSSSGKNDGAGKWEITGDGSGGVALKLTFENGEVKTYRLSAEGTKTFLNGKRYFKTGFQDEAQHRPSCP